jgi:serine palmitoyltransferase
MIYHPAKIKDISRICLKNGVAIVVVGYPACPIDACRIRFCVSAGHTDEDIEKGFQVTLDALRQTDCIFQNTEQPSSLHKAKKLNLAELESIPKAPREMIPLYENIEQKYDENDPEPEKIKENEINICTYDIHGFEKDEQRQERLINIIKEYGCGSCGPRNFYGGTLEHVKLEEELKKFYNTNEAIIISYGHNIMSSVIPVFAKPGNVILVDELCNYPIQLGCRLGKAKVIKYLHNNINDLEMKLNEAKNMLNSKYALISIVTEGLFQHDYSLAPLKEIVNLKHNFLENNRNSNLYIIVDDSLGIGNIGPNLKGSLDYSYLNLKDDIDIVCGSFEFIMNSVGGFLAGNINKIYKCRLFAAGYIFSASSPPYSCTAAKDSFEKIEKDGKRMKQALDLIKKEFRKKMEKVKNVEIVGSDESSCLLLKCEDVDRMVQYLRKEGFYVVKQCHLKEDWCQNKFIKVNLGKWFDSQNIDKFIDALIKY